MEGLGERRSSQDATMVERGLRERRKKKEQEERKTKRERGHKRRPQISARWGWPVDLGPVVPASKGRYYRPCVLSARRGSGTSGRG